jgi:CDP-diglyceride synthetase
MSSHKTVVGFGAGVLAAVVITLAKSRIAWPGGLVAHDHGVALGLRFGTGAMAGDAAKSFVKRRLGIPPGTPWIPWDQVDFRLGALILLSGQAALSWPDLGDQPSPERHGARPGQPHGLLDRSASREVVDLPLPHVAAYEFGDLALQHEGLQHVLLRQQADQTPAFDDRQAPHAALEHDEGRR